MHVERLETILREGPALRDLARSLLASEHDVEDALQETWIQLIENPPRQPEAIRGWLHRVLRNNIYGRFRTLKRRPGIERRAAASGEAPSTAELVADAELHSHVARSVLELREPYRRTVLLRYFHGMPLKRIAECEGIEPSSARARLHRGLGMLRDQLKADLGRDLRPLAVLVAPLCADGTADTSPAAEPPNGVDADDSVASGSPADGASPGIGTIGTKLAVPAGLVALALVAFVGLSRLNPFEIRGAGDSTSEATDGMSFRILEREIALTDARKPRATPAPVGPAPSAASSDDTAGTITYEGIVVGPNDRGIAAASVEALRTDRTADLFRTSALPAGERVASTVCDDEGRFTLEVPRGALPTILARAEGYAPTSEFQPPPDREVRIRARRGARIEGTVVRREDGSPVVGALVDADVMFHPGLPRHVVEVTTDGDGRFLFEDLPVGETTLLATPPREPASLIHIVPTTEGGSNEVRIEVERGYELHGRLIDAETRQPIEGGTIHRSYRVKHPVTTGADGTFRIEGLLAKPSPFYAWKVMASAPGYATATLSLDATETDPATPTDVELERGRIARGRILGPEGDPVPHAEVVVVPLVTIDTVLVWMTLRTQADAEGRFELRDIPRRPHVMYVREPGRGTAVLPLSGAEEIEIGDVRLDAPGSIEGRVLDVDDRPVANARVLASLAFYSHETEADTDTYFQRAEITDEDGRYRFEQVAPGCYGLYASPENLPILRREDLFDVGAGESVDGVDFRVEAPYTFEGVVRDEDGNPVTGAHLMVLARNAMHVAGFGSSRHDGSFRIAGLPDPQAALLVRPGPYVAQITDRPLSTIRLPLVDLRHSSHELVLPYGAVLRGVVTDDIGNPLVEWQVAAECEGERIDLALTDSNGWFELVAPTDRLLTLTLRHPGDLETAPPRARVEGMRAKNGESIEVVVPR